MKRYNANAYKQAYVIINFLIDYGEIVVPTVLLDNIENRMNKNYYFDLNDIKQIDLLEDTEKILTEIYLECMINKSEKNKIKKLAGQLKSIILEEKNLEENKNLLPMNLKGLSFFERLKIKFNKLAFGKVWF